MRDSTTIVSFPRCSVRPNTFALETSSQFQSPIFRMIPVEPRRSDNLLTAPIDHDKRCARFQRFSEENLKDVLLVAITLRMLLPDQRIGRDREKGMPIFRPERPQLNKFAFEIWLKIKCHPNHESTRITTNSNGLPEPSPRQPGTACPERSPSGFDRRLHSQSIDRFANIFHRHFARDVRRTDLRRYDEANFSGFEFFVELYCLEDPLAPKIPWQPCG